MKNFLLVWRWHHPLLYSGISSGVDGSVLSSSLQTFCAAATSALIVVVYSKLETKMELPHIFLTQKHN